MKLAQGSKQQNGGVLPILCFIALYCTGVSGQSHCDALQQHDGYKSTALRVVNLNEMKVIAPFDVLAGNEMTCVLVSFSIDKDGKPYDYESVSAYPDNGLLRFAIATLKSAVFKPDQDNERGFMYFQLKAEYLY
ncbi:hypothetical protein [Rheinheimera sp. WS51]|uniref:hypothetical protein n=1 Tax=Rheinheimera sp. WS51 TaxID=3425886 RepID=UPI003D8B3EFF